MRAKREFDWRDRVVQNVERAVKPSSRLPGALHRFNLTVPDPLWPLLLRAATRRGASVTAYIRRATIAFVAHDLNLPLERVLQLDPRWSNPGSNRTDADPEGIRGGSWEIEDLR